MYEVLWDETPDHELCKIKLTEGKWENLIYNYKTVKIIEKDGGDAILKFDYDIVETPTNLDIDNLTPKDKQNFENLLGDVLVNIIERDIDEDRTDNSDKSDI
jgi:hypothetical protein